MIMQESAFNQGLLDFLSSSATPFHAVANMCVLLEKTGFVRLWESDAWSLKPESRYYVTRNESSLIVFTTGKVALPISGIRMVGAHTDSPGLKVKPRPEIQRSGYFQLGVEVYGSPLLNPWFDRELSLAGRVTCIDDSDRIENALVDFKKPVALIPSLAIHLDREANKNRSINAQDDLPPLVLLSPDKQEIDFREMLLLQLQREHPELKISRILDFDINLYEAKPASFAGLDREFICSGRLDNLLSCYAGLMALMETGDEYAGLLVCNDHEEVGSASAAGAQGSFLKSVIDRLCPHPEDRIRSIDRSALISADVAHGIHPNFASKSDPRHGPILNQGPVIKFNAGQRYATDSKTAALFRNLCIKAGIPVQEFVMRSDLTCGTTIGPISAAQLGVKTADVGAPVLAMHSIRETAGSKDAYFLYQAFYEYWGSGQSSDQGI